MSGCAFCYVLRDRLEAEQIYLTPNTRKGNDLDAKAEKHLSE